MKTLLALVLLSSIPACAPSPAAAFDNGQYEGVDPSTRAWFKSVRSPHGVPCCDIADGHQVEWTASKDGYTVYIEGEWHDVPPEALVTNAWTAIREKRAYNANRADHKKEARLAEGGKKW